MQTISQLLNTFDENLQLVIRPFYTQISLLTELNRHPNTMDKISRTNNIGSLRILIYSLQTTWIMNLGNLFDEDKDSNMTISYVLRNIKVNIDQFSEVEVVKRMCLTGNSKDSINLAKSFNVLSRQQIESYIEDEKKYREWWQTSGLKRYRNKRLAHFDTESKIGYKNHLNETHKDSEICIKWVENMFGELWSLYYNGRIDKGIMDLYSQKIPEAMELLFDETKTLKNCD